MDPSERSLDESARALPSSRDSSEDAASAIRLVLAGHHPLTLYGLSHVLEKEGDCTVLGVCTDPNAIVETVRCHQPDMVILDLDPSTTFALLRRIQRERFSTRVVVLAAAGDREAMNDALKRGACAVVLKEMPPQDLVMCLRKVHRGEHAVETNDAERVVTRLFRRSKSARHLARQLTSREAEIARLAIQGVPTSEIAARLDLKQGTVKIHLHSVYTKLNVNGRLGLMLFNRRHGLA